MHRVKPDGRLSYRGPPADAYVRRPYAAERIMAHVMPQAYRSGMVPPHLMRYAYGALPPPTGRPTGPTAPSGERPLPGETVPVAESSGAGTINPFYVGLAVTVVVMVTMVIWE